MAVEVVRPLGGLFEATVFKEGEASARIQWLQSGTWNFFQPVPDDMFGWRLHMADIAINKALAAADAAKSEIMPIWP